MPGWTLAHQGGWDEVLLVAGPVAVFAALLWVANRRAGRMGAVEGEPDRDPASGDRGEDGS